jgi:DNA-binding IclR family transcriptional regulator
MARPGARPALAATRAVELLNLLAASPTEVFTLSQLVERLGLNIASCHAILNTLTQSGFVERNPNHKTYRLGAPLIALGHAALEAHPAIDAARDEARDLAERLKMEVLVTARSSNEIVAVARAGRLAAKNISLRVGQRLPLWPPWGAPFMAWATDADIAAWLARGPYGTEERRAEYLALLETVRERGYAVTVHNALSERIDAVLAQQSATPRDEGLQAELTRLIGELGPGSFESKAVDSIDPAARHDLAQMSAPVFDGRGHVAFTLGLSGFPDGLTSQAVSDYADQLKASTLRLTRLSNGRPPGLRG